MNHGIDLLDAWSCWLSGQEVDPQLHIGPLTVLWWSRVGKIAAFIGGATVLLDLIGPERIRTFGQRTRTHDWETLVDRRSWFVVATSGVVTLAITVNREAILGTLVGFLLLATISGLVGWAMIGLGKLLEMPRTERVIRWTAFLLLLTGFHFDLLAS